MRRLGVALVAAVTLAAGTLVGTTPARADAPQALGGCGWQATLADLNTPASIRSGVLKLTNFGPVSLALTGNVDWSADPYRDPSWRLWFHSLKWTESLVVSGKPDDLALARQIVTDFVADNPDPGTNDGAWDDHATSFRTSLFVCMWQKHTDPALRAWLGPILRAHAQVVLTRYVGAWNHGTMQSLALLAAGCVLGEPSWRDAAAARLQNELTAGVDVQGAVLEQAPGYASFIQTLHRDAAAHQSACGVPVPTGLYDRLAAVDTFTAQATTPDGTFVQIGDTWPERPNGAAGPHSSWVATRSSGSPPADLVKVYDAGYVFARDSWTHPTQHYSLRFGPGRYTHGHNDHLAMTYWSRGFHVLVDSGYDGYADRGFRTWSRSLQAHNVPIVSRAKFDAGAPTALVGRSAGKGARSWQLRDRAFAGAERHRTVLVDDRMKLMVVRDDIDADQPRGLQLLWHLDPSWRKERVVNNARNTTASFLSADGRYRASILQLAAPRTRVPTWTTTAMRGQTSPTFQGFVSRHRGDRTPAWVLEARRHAARKQSVVTLILVTRVGERVRAMWNTPHGNDRIRVTVGKTTRVYDSSRRGAMSAR